MTALVPGFYGKLPSHGDFVRRRLSGSFVGLWDSWLQSAIAQSKEQLGANWLEIYLGSPLWRFVFTPGVCGPEMSAGILMPSVDRAGRYFPLTMVVSLPDPVNPLPLAAEYDDWFSRAESILLTALDDGGHFDLDAFDRQVQDCVLEFKSPPRLPDGSAAAVFPGQSKSWHIGIASVDHLGASLRHLHWKQLGAHFDPLSMWWTNGSEHVSPSALLSEGIPPADSYAAMLDGQWRTRQWPSIQLESVSRLTTRPSQGEMQEPAAADMATPHPAGMPMPHPSATGSAAPAAAPAGGMGMAAPAGMSTEPPAEVPAAPTAVAAETGASEPSRDVPPAPSQPPAASAPTHQIIPEFDPMEILDPTAEEAAEASVPSEKEPGLAAPQDDLAPVSADPAAIAASAAAAETVVQPTTEVDPLDAIEAAQGTDTPLDPLEALGLSPATGSGPDLADLPAPAVSVPSMPSSTEAVATEAAPSGDTLEFPTVSEEPDDADDTTRADTTIPAAVPPAVSGPVFWSAAATHAGGQSDFNEDALLERRDAALWAVADGSGGHWIGDVASQAVVSELATVAPSAELGQMADDVKRKLSQAHQYLQDNLDRNSETPGEVGAAVAVFVATESMSACLSAGPVRIYRCRNGVLDRLTPDDASQARLVGHQGELLVDSRFHEIEVGDWYLVCSRGLYEELDEDEIVRAFTASGPKDVCEQLMSQTLSRGSQHNVTVVVVRAASPNEA